MRTLTEINAERRNLIYEAAEKINGRKEIGKRYTPAQLSEMCDGLVPPETFKKALSRADSQARIDKNNGRRARAWKSAYSFLFGDWGLRVKAYPVSRKYTIKWFDEDGQLIRTTERIVNDYEAEFVRN